MRYLGLQTKHNTPEESHMLLSWYPDRLGHATFLSDELKNTYFVDAPPQVLEGDIDTTDSDTRERKGRYMPCIEICLSSNIMFVQVMLFDCTSYGTQPSPPEPNLYFPSMRTISAIT